MHVFGFVAPHVAFLALIACAGLGVGTPLVHRIRFSSPLEHFVFAVPLGLGVMGVLLFLLGLLGALHGWLVFVGFLAFSACGLAFASRQIATLLVRGPPRRTVSACLYSLSGILILAPALWLALFPPTAVDALAYHLPAAKAYLQLHRVRPLLYLRFPVLPALGEMLFSGAMLLFDDVTAQLIEFLFLVLLLGALVAWSRRIRRPLVGLWSIGILAGTPSLMYFASTAYVDVGLTAFTTLAFYALHCYSETGDTTWLPLAGALGGCAASTKHSGLIVLILIFVSSVVVTRSHRLGLRKLTPLALAAFCLGAPWYLWSAYWTGNPVWPLLGRFLGYGFWTRADVALLDWSLKGYGWGTSLQALALIPWNLAFHEPAGEPAFSAAPFLLLPVTLWWAFRHRGGRGLLLAIATYFVFWFYTSQQLRFLLPVLPLLAFVESRAIEELISRPMRALRAPTRRLTAILVFLALAYPLLGVYRLAGGLPPLPTTPSARETFLHRWLPSYATYQELNRRYGRGYTIYALNDEVMKYYCDGTPIGDWLGPGRYADVPLDSASRLSEFLHGLNADFFLLKEYPAGARIESDPAFGRFFEKIRTEGDYKLFRVGVAAR